MIAHLCSRLASMVGMPFFGPKKSAVVCDLSQAEIVVHKERYGISLLRRLYLMPLFRFVKALLLTMFLMHKRLVFLYHLDQHGISLHQFQSNLHHKQGLLASLDRNVPKQL